VRRCFSTLQKYDNKGKNSFLYELMDCFTLLKNAIEHFIEFGKLFFRK